MNATITNYRGISAATLDITKICLLAGTNEAGKTSASQALAAALTGDPVPIQGVKKTQAGLLVRSGTATGSVDLTTEAGSTHIQWPSAKVNTEGKAPFASHFATGLRSIINMDDKERVKVLTEYMKATPTRTDLDSALASMELPDEVLAKLWDLIEKQGWDNAASQVKEKGARLKGQWQQTAGEQYGSKKAESWIPEGYEAGLEQQSEDKLKAVVTDARDALEAAIASDAVDDSRRADLEALAALKPEREAALQEAKNTPENTVLASQLVEANGLIKELSDKRDVLKAKLAGLPPATQSAGMPCPECGAVLTVSGGNLTQASVIPEEELKSRTEAIAAVQKKLDDLTAAIGKHMTQVSGIQQKIKEGERAREITIANALRDLGESAKAEEELKKPIPPTSTISIDDCRNALSLAEKTLKAYQSKTEADRLHETITKNQELIDKLAPEGIREDVLLKSIKKFNESLEPFSKAAGWRLAALDTDLMPTYGGTPYLLLSESAKFRVRVILQMAMAKMDGSEALIVDAADILDKGGRNGLFKAVKAVGLPCLIAMTIDGKELVPKLGALGNSYWLNDGVAEVV